MKRKILISGAFLAIFLGILWLLDIIKEPLYSIGISIITLISYFFIKDKEENKTIIRQKHTGIGDNVGGDKVIKK